MGHFTAAVRNDLPRVRESPEDALAATRFGVLAHIDAQATLPEKVGLEREAQRILGVGIPRLAAQALDVDPDAALLLPRAVTLRDVGGATEGHILDGARAFDWADDAARKELEPLARAAPRRLVAALEAGIQEGATS